MAALKWFAGTSGYSYKEWKGVFYPEDCRSEEMLAYYASRLPAVEINNTFYRMPKRHVLEQWAAAVPAQFRFVVKASRRITHQAKLEDAGESIAYLSARLGALEDKLGAVLFQLPPFLRKGPERLSAFLEAWPKSLPCAIEFRHESWFDEEIFALLAKHRAALCISDDGKLALPDTIRTTDWLYLRLRRESYTPQRLAGWVTRTRASDATSAFAFFKHEDAGAGPRLAEKFLEYTRRPAAQRAPRKRPAAKRRA